VENAIKHGVEYVTGPGVIDIEGELHDGELLLRVRDNGPGIGESADATGRHGVGLRNTVARLEQLYGAADRFSIAPGAHGGTVVELRLPYHLRPDAVASRQRSDDEHVARDDSIIRGGARVE
jgi:sensor histidine kinase YesM